MADITKQLIIYGDDTSVLVSGRHLTKTIQHCFDILDRFYNYCNFNKVSINPLKRNHIIYKPKYCKLKKSKAIKGTTCSRVTVNS